MPDPPGGCVETPSRIDLHVPIAKVVKEQDGSRTVIGVVTDEVLDRDGQIVDKGWASERLNDWFDSAANVRQMHSGTYPPAGKGKDLKWAKGRPVLRSKIVEPTAIRLLDEGVYTGYSIGIFDPCIYTDPGAPNGRIGKAGPEDPGWIGEVSLVDLPSCPTALFSLVKRATKTSPAELVERLELSAPDGTRALMTPKRMKALNKAFDLGGSANFTATLRKIVAEDAKSNPEGINQYSGGGGSGGGGEGHEPAAGYGGSGEAEKDRAALTPAGRIAYDEAASAGATHSDAMEAGHTEGYTKSSRKSSKVKMVLANGCTKSMARASAKWYAAFKAVSPNVGGGVDVDKLPDSAFVIIEGSGDDKVRKFPIVTPGDVSDAASSWGRYKGPMSFEQFKKRLTAIANREGPAFVKELPQSWKDGGGKSASQKELSMAEQTGKIAGAAVEAAVTQALKGGDDAPHAIGVTCPVCQNGARKLAANCPGCRGVGIIPVSLVRQMKSVIADHKAEVKAAALAAIGKDDDDDDDVDDAISDLMDDLEEVAEAQADDESGDDEMKPTDQQVDAAIQQVGAAVGALSAAQAADMAADAANGKAGKNAPFEGAAKPFGEDDDKTDDGNGDGDGNDDGNGSSKMKKSKKGKGKKLGKQTDLNPPDSAGASPPDMEGDRPGAGDTIDEVEDDQGASSNKGKGKGKPGKKQGQLKPADGTDTIDDNATSDRPPPATTLKPGKGKAKGADGDACPKCKGAGTVGDDGMTCPKCKGSGMFGGKGGKGKSAKKSKKAKKGALVSTGSPVARRVHDVLCPAYPTDAVKTAWDFGDLPVADTVNPTWFADRLALLSNGTVKATADSVGEAYQAFAAASKLAALTTPRFEALRSAANKTFMDAYPNTQVKPGLISPEDFQRGYLSGTNPQSSSTTRVPTPDLKPTFAASDFQRGPLTDNEARPTLTGGTSVAKGKKAKKGAKIGKADDSVPTPSPSRLFYRNSDKDQATSAMALLHDHIAQHYPGICPMDPVIPGTEIDRDGLIGQPADRNVMHPDLPSLTSPAPAGSVGTLTPTSAGTANKGAEEAPLTKAAAEAMVKRQVSKIEAKHAKREKRLRKRAREAERKAQEALRLPDRSKAPMRGQQFRVISGGDPEKELKTKERLKTIATLKAKIADRNPAVSQRARDALMQIATPEEFATVITEDADEA